MQCRKRTIFFDLFIAWLWTALLISPTLICQTISDNLIKTENVYHLFCSSFGVIGFIAMLFGPFLLMPLFLVLLNIKKKQYLYSDEKFLVNITKILLILTSILCSMLFIASVMTLNFSDNITNSMTNPTMRTWLTTILTGLWFAPPGMLFMLALFMIQFGLLRETLIKSFKPLLIFIASGGLTAATFAFFATLLGIYYPSPFIIPSFIVQIFQIPTIELVNIINPLIKTSVNPYYVLLLNFVAPLPMIFLFNKYNEKYKLT